jgi:hypothetical protein
MNDIASQNLTNIFIRLADQIPLNQPFTQSFSIVLLLIYKTLITNVLFLPLFTRVKITRECNFTLNF